MRDPLLDPDPGWQNEATPCADLLAAEWGIDLVTGEALAPGVAALLQGATAAQWCAVMDQRPGGSHPGPTTSLAQHA